MSLNINIIGFAGRLRSGKTQLATICEKFGYERLYFAKPLKQLIAKLIDGTIDDVNRLKKGDTEVFWCKKITEEDCELVAKETYIPLDVVKEKILGINFTNTRDMLQIIGTDLIREYNPDWHVDRTKAMIEEGKKYVIDDVRFTNEKKCIEELGGIIWFVVRPICDNISHHSSEETLKWQDFKYNVIINDQSVEYITTIWEMFMQDYENSCKLRFEELVKLKSNKTYLDRFMADGNRFNALSFLLISRTFFSYHSLYRNNNNAVNITNVIPCDDNSVIVEWKDNMYDNDIVTNPLEIEDLKIYL